MAKNDVKVLEPKNVSTRTFIVEDRTTSSATATIKAGEPVKFRTAEDSNDVIILATGDPEQGTDIMAGIAATESTETSSADGTVEVYIPVPGVTVFRCRATTPANVNTAAKRLAIMGDVVSFDLTSGTFTVDENEGTDDDVHGLIIVDVDTSNGDIDFVFKSRVLQGGSAIA